MKHFLKTWLPILLVLAILVGACWFFLYERTDLTTDVLAYWGDHFVERERYNRAIAFYSWACKLSPDNTVLPICLADTYRLSGNDTKAEYTLVNAITENPDSLSLYTALCRVYVAQDKLLDAEDMLSRITNDEIRAQIDELRPSDPVISPESGYYDDYLDVTISAPNGTIYYVLNGDFPASQDDIYTGSITLPGGETKIVAISVGSNGLVSNAVYAGYTIGNVVEEVQIQDPVLNQTVRELLGKTAADTIMSDELWEIETLDIPEGVTTLDDLKLFAGVTSLSIHQTDLHDFSALSELPLLEQLDLSGCTLSGEALQVIASIASLKTLNLNGCAVADVDVLAGLQELEVLDLSNNTVSDITALSTMSSLRELYLTNNPIQTIGALKGISTLEILNCSSCGLTRISPVSDMTQLLEFYAADNTISDISPLEACKSLTTLDISHNKITDISVLGSLTSLESLIANNNEIQALPAFSQKTPLWNLQISYNEIESLEPLSGMDTLNFVSADYNKITSVACLESCITIVQIDVWNNPINIDEAKKLQDVGIIVNYNPNYEAPEETEES